MSKHVGGLAMAIAMLGLFALPSSASASVEFGDNCTADYFELEAPYSLFEGSNSANPLPTSAPSSGVITKWKVNIAPTPGSGLLRLVAIHPVAPGSPGSAQVLGESTGRAIGGQNSFDARIPVSAGDRIALGSGEGENLIACKSESSPGTIGIVVSPPGASGSVPYLEQGPAPLRVPLSAVLEPDADHDGYGDETQDKCPQMAATQGPCIPVAVDAVSVKGRNSVTVLVAVNETAPVSVSGTVKLGKGKTAKLKAPAKTLTPGPIGKFKLKFPGSLKERLKKLGPGQSLQLKVAATATGAGGTVSSDKLKMKLKGGE
jgi:hypothetical protein